MALQTDLVKVIWRKLKELKWLKALH